MVDAFGEQLAGELKADAAVCCMAVSMVIQQDAGDECDVPPVTSTISFARAVMMMFGEVSIFTA